MDEHLARERLESERDELLHALRSLERDLSADESEEAAVAELSARDQHPADVASEAYEHERIVGLAKDLRAVIDEVDAALDRLGRGLYGSCEICDAPIDDDRLEAVPATRYCVHHQEEWEHDNAGLTAAGRQLSAVLARRATARSSQAQQPHPAFEFLPSEDESEEPVELAAEEAALHVEREH